MTGLGVQADIEFRCDLGYATRVRGACVADIEDRPILRYCLGLGGRQVLFQLSRSENFWDWSGPASPTANGMPLGAPTLPLTSTSPPS